MFFNLAWRNSKRSRNENLIYFLTMVTAVAAFYIVLSLGAQDVIRFLSSLESDAVERLLTNLLPTVYVCALLFVFFLAMMLTAACTNRKLFPNMEDIEPFNVIYQTAEDGMGDTIKPRLIEAGADLSRVMVIDDTEEALTLSDDRIEKAVRQNRVRLVIIDPVQAFIGADVDMNRANEVRPVFRKLGMIAEKTGCAIVLIGHLNKSSGTQSTYRGLGSIDIMAAVRSLIFIGKVRKDPTTRVLIHEKSSLAPPGETMAFKLGDEDGFRWVGAYEISADELLDGKEGKATETKLERGAKLIRELLADKKEISIRELDEKAKEQGISGRTMRDVRSRMKNELEYQVNEKQENSIRLKE